MIKNISIIVIIALFTYLVRLSPMYFKGILNKIPRLDEFLMHSSAALMSALFVTSFISFPVKVDVLGIGLLTLLFVFISYRKWKSLGLSILVGILAHLLFSMVLPL